MLYGTLPGWHYGLHTHASTIFVYNGLPGLTNKPLSIYQSICFALFLYFRRKITLEVSFKNVSRLFYMTNGLEEHIHFSHAYLTY